MLDPKLPSCAKPRSSSTTTTTLEAPAGDRGAGAKLGSDSLIVRPIRPPAPTGCSYQHRYGRADERNSEPVASSTANRGGLHESSRLRRAGPAPDHRGDDAP